MVLVGWLVGQGGFYGSGVYMLMGMTVFVDIRVSRFARRLRGVAEVGGAQASWFGSRLVDFADGLVDVGSTLGAGEGVRLLLESGEDVGGFFEQVRVARDGLEGALSVRAAAVREAGPVLEGLGFSQADSARLLGLPKPAYLSLVSPRDENELWGRAVLGSAPAVVDGQALVLGSWVMGEDGVLVPVAGEPVLVSGLKRAVSLAWERVFGPAEQAGAGESDGDVEGLEGSGESELETVEGFGVEGGEDEQEPVEVEDPGEEVVASVGGSSDGFFSDDR